MTFAIRRSLSAAAIATALLAHAPAHAQVGAWSSYDRWGWSQQTPEKGRQQACASSKRDYNTLVSMYNSEYRFSKNEHIRRAWMADIEDAKRSIERWCNG